MPPSPPAITLTLPWVILVSDNDKYTISKGRIVLTPRYREAKEKGGWLVRGAMKGRAPLVGHLALLATLSEPNTSRVRDCSNYSKLVHDILTGIVYQDDGLLDDVHWVRGPINPRHPRLDITVRVLP